MMGGYGTSVRCGGWSCGTNTNCITGSIILCALAVLMAVGLILLSEKKKAAVGRRCASIAVSIASRH